MKKYNIILACILVAICALIFIQTKDMLEITNDMPGAGIWPRVLGVGMAICAVALVIQSVKMPASESEKKIIDFKSPGFKRVLLLFAVFAGYGVLMNYLGFIISALVFIPVVMIILGEKRWLRIAIVDAAIVLFIYITFTKLLYVVLPRPFFM